MTATAIVGTARGPPAQIARPPKNREPPRHRNDSQWHFPN